MNKITLATIAADLGVSTATVSLALRGSPLVAQTTSERVQLRARELGYVYDRRAASLRTQRSDIVGVIVRDVVNPFFAEVLRSIETELGQYRQTFLLCNHDDDLEKQAAFISSLQQFGADGVIMSPSVGTTAADMQTIDANLPVVQVARHVEGVHVPTFLGDDAPGMAAITTHLIECGHTDIVLLGGTRMTSSGRARRAGFAQAFRDAGIDLPDRPAIEAPYSREAGFEAVAGIMAGSKRPTAIACCSDTLAMGVMHGLRQHGLTPGVDVSVTGYDDIAEARFSYPPLTTVADGHAEIGRRAAQALYMRLTDKTADSTQWTEPTLVQPELKLRGSVATIR